MNIINKTITVAKTAGFCFGVNRAVKLTYELSTQNNVYTLGPIIHNPQVTNDLKKKGVGIIHSPKEAKKDDTIVIRSHGVDKATLDYLESNNIKYIDATCPFVTKIHKIVTQESLAGNTIIIAGDKNHPEVIGISGHCYGDVFCVKDWNELQNLMEKLSQKSCVLVAQTTFNKNIWDFCSKKIKKLYTNVKIFDTICNATNERQEEAMEIARQSDLMIIIGGKESSNTFKLKEVCDKYCKSVLIETFDDLDTSLLMSSHKIGITAGASTPAYIIMEVKNKMSEIIENNKEELTFAELFEQSTSEKLYTGKRVKGIVTSVSKTEVNVDIGAKQTGYIPFDELTEDSSKKAEEIVAKGDEIEVVVLKINDQEGTVMLSKKRVDSEIGFEKIKEAYENGTVLTGTVVNIVKGGALVLTDKTKVFVPAALLSDKRIEDLNTLLKTQVEFKIIEIKEDRRRAVGSVREVLKEKKAEIINKFWENIEEGQILTGPVKSLTSYGAFVDLGGVDGMIHITELSWGKIKHPSEIVNVGDVVEVYVKAIDRENKKISLGYKKTEDNPWLKAAELKVDDVKSVKITSIMPFGAFAEIIPGVEGLIHISQIANAKVQKIADYLSVGQVVDAKITEIDLENKRISLSIRALLEQEKENEEKEVMNQELPDGVELTQE